MLKDDLAIQDWKVVCEQEDVDEAYNYFLDIFLNLYEKNCPVKKYKIKDNKDNTPWITNGLRNACKKKNQLYKKYINNPSIQNESKYKQYKNRLTKIMRSCRKKYYNDIIESNKNMKGTWNVLNKLIKGQSNAKQDVVPEYFSNKDKIIKDMPDIVNGFNEYFVRVGQELAEQIAPSIIKSDEVGQWNNNSMFLHPVDELEIIGIVNKWKHKMSCDWNDVDMSIVKQIIKVIAKPLSYICNLSFQTGKFPDKMKMAKVVPLYKTGDKHLFTNYRPISLLSQFSKILEKLFAERLMEFIEKDKILTDSQYGFRSGRSTSHALIELTDEITKCIDSKHYVAGIFVDLKKAFDTIDHHILLNKLEKYGIRGVVGNWVKNYLQNRKQFVQIGEHKSSFMELSCGVPQGSVLGPILFILYINDICNISKSLKYFLFADDTTILCCGKNEHQIIKTITAEINKLKQWFDQNKLSLNVSKTKIIWFGNFKIRSDVQFEIDQTRVEQTHEHKFLGVIIDHKMCWKPHVSYISSKISKNIAIIGKTKYILDPKSLLTLYSSLVLPYLSYCVEVWGNTYKTTLKPLFYCKKEH